MIKRSGEQAALVKQNSGMKTGIRTPIQLQLSIAVIFIILAVVVTLSLGMRERQRKNLYQQTVKIGMASLNHFENNAAIPLLENDLLSLNNLLKDSTDVEGILYAFILNAEGVISAHTDLNKIGGTHQFIFARNNLTSENEVTYFNYILPSGERVLNLSRPVEFSEKHLGQVHVGVSLDFIEESIYRETISILEMTSFILFFGIVLALFYGYRFSKPIAELVEATRQISRGNYKHRVEMNRKDEFGNLALAFNQMSEELLAQSIMKESFGKYVGREILDMILRYPEKNWLKGDIREATVVFSDIRGFTSFSEKKKPEKVVEDLNEYFEIATSIIAKHGGYVDKFIGDAVLGVFGVPVFYPDHAIRAVRACLEMIDVFQKIKQGDGNLLPSAALSANMGRVVSGNIGSQAKMEYTVIGDAVNLASRINSLAGPGELIIGNKIYQKLSDRLEVIALDPVNVKGKSEMVQTYKVINLHE